MINGVQFCTKFKMLSFFQGVLNLREFKMTKNLNQK